jgi:hypothetical protein
MDEAAPTRLALEPAAAHLQLLSLPRFLGSTDPAAAGSSGTATFCTVPTALDAELGDIRCCRLISGITGAAFAPGRYLTDKQ